MSNRVVIDPNIHFGKPCVAGTRITVNNVLELVRDGCSSEEITSDFYQDLTHEDVKACVQYAMDVISFDDLRVADAA